MSDNKFWLEELLLNGGVLIGSRALGVHTKNSDYDIAICYDYLPPEFKQILASTKNDSFNIKNYFNRLPPLGNAWVIRDWPGGMNEISIDILIFENSKVIQQMEKVIDDMKKVPKVYLQEKHLRIEFFETGLYLQGWLENLSWK